MAEDYEVDTIHLVRTDVEILKRDVSNIQNMLGRLDTAIDKIAEASAGITKILTAHDGDLSALKQDVEERKRLAEKENDLLHRRISQMKDESAERHLRNHREVMEAIKDMKTDTTEELKHLTDRVSILEKWKWWIMGGSWAIGFAIATLFQMGGIIQYFIDK